MGRPMQEKTPDKGEKSPRFQPLPVLVTARDVATGEVVTEHSFDFNDLDKREWFVRKLCIWAFLNPSRPCAVEIKAAAPVPVG